MSVAEVEKPQESDFDLAKRAAAGDGKAFEELYRRHYRRVYALTLRMMGNPTEAEDMTQDVFLQLFNKIGMFRGESQFTTWLHRMTVNQVLMYFRKKSTRSELLTDEGETPIQIVKGTEKPGTMPVIDRISLERALQQLPPGYRTVFVLHDIEGYEHYEISDMLGIAEGTSKSQLHKARLKLRQLIRQEAASN
ncbi:MAG TPA: sigma-70 family RNA polymerase sigma factor [Pyrinomonadaceae bacterium]|nr:sigma-70 family RNA polymerase sigma factor [Pyrinomonadaceae bacterium]